MVTADLIQSDLLNFAIASDFNGNFCYFRLKISVAYYSDLVSILSDL